MQGWFKSLFKKEDVDLSPDLTTRISKLEGIIGFDIDDPSLFLKALRHRSMLSEEKYETFDSYERLEFLGDAVLDLIAAEILFKAFPRENEGFLTKARAKLVRGKTLAHISVVLGLEELMELGERNSGLILSKNILADAFESIIAAIYITMGYKEAFTFVDSVIKEHLDLNELVNTVDNYKSVLLEYVQARKLPMPDYRLVSESGPGHNRTFEVQVWIGEKSYGKAKGKSKKKAEQAAARLALKEIEE
ncbi:MAG: ribonuclease III [Balneolaceae bacterium]|nr:ribonuclease III [Balneolaceae bacterium]